MTVAAIATEVYVPLTSDQFTGLINSNRENDEAWPLGSTHLDGLCQHLIANGTPTENLQGILKSHDVAGVLGVKHSIGQRVFDYSGAIYTGLLYGFLAYVVIDGLFGPSIGPTTTKIFATLVGLLAGTDILVPEYDADDMMANDMIAAYRELVTTYEAV